MKMAPILYHDDPKMLQMQHNCFNASNTMSQYIHNNTAI